MSCTVSFGRRNKELSSSLAVRWTLLDKLIQELRFRRIVPLIADGGILADMGCGDGSFLRHVRSRVAFAYGVDLNIEQASGSDTISFHRGDLNQTIPLKDESADVVTALAVIEHLMTPQKFVSEIRRILKTGGKCILTTPSPRSKPLLEFLAYRLKVISEKDIRDHRNYFTKPQLLRLFVEFRSVDITSFQCGFNTLIVAGK